MERSNQTGIRKRVIVPGGSVAGTATRSPAPGCSSRTACRWTPRNHGFFRVPGAAAVVQRVRHDARRAAAPLCLHHAQCEGSRPAIHRPDGRHGLATGIAQRRRITAHRAARPMADRRAGAIRRRTAGARIREVPEVDVGPGLRASVSLWRRKGRSARFLSLRSTVRQRRPRRHLQRGRGTRHARRRRNHLAESIPVVETRSRVTRWQVSARREPCLRGAPHHGLPVPATRRCIERSASGTPVSRIRRRPAFRRPAARQSVATRQNDGARTIPALGRTAVIDLRLSKSDSPIRLDRPAPSGHVANGCVGVRQAERW